MAKINPFPGIVTKAKRTARKATGRRRAAKVSPATFIGKSRAESSEQKAIWHNVTGAGRSHVKRKFFDLNESDKVALVGALEQSVAARLKRV